MPSSSSKEDRTRHPGVLHIHGLRKASQCFQKEGSKELAIACEAAKETLEQQYITLLHQHQGRPKLSSKSCDGTPMSVFQREASQLPSGAWVRTRGRAAPAFLVTLQFVRALHQEGHDTRVVMGEAVPLQYGKKTRTIAVVCLNDWQTLRQGGTLVSPSSIIAQTAWANLHWSDSSSSTTCTSNDAMGSC